MPVDEGFQGSGGRNGQSTNVPVPDPSLLTTQQLRESVDGLKELIGARLDAMDEATDLRLELFRAMPADVDARIDHLRDVTRERFALEDEKVSSLQALHETKFLGIALQFHERDTRTDQTAATSKQALDAALLAAKELVGQQNEANAAAATKAELSTIKQIDQIVVLVGTIEKALGAQIIEIKERIDRNEGGIVGGRNAVIEGRDSRNEGRLVAQVLASFLSVMLLVVSVAVTIYVATHK